jgi:hypothetical protein
MSNATFLWHVTMAVHEDRVRSVQQSRTGRACPHNNPVHRPLGLYRRLACRLHRIPFGPARVAP